MDEKYWDRVARDYDGEIFDSLASDRNGVMLRHLDRFASPRGTAFDVGCGVGKYAPALSKRFRTVRAADLSAECIRHAKALHGNLKNVQFHKGDLSREKVAQGKADFVLCTNVLIMPSEKMRAGILKGLSGMLKPGGGLLLLVPSLESSLYAHARRAEWLRRSPRTRVAAATSLPSGKGVLAGLLSIDGVPTKHWLKEELDVTLRAAGFKDVTVEKVEYDWSTEFADPPRWMKDPYPWDWAVAGVRA
ncbi:MAG TPA: class I SAM-dependent methyltransferase [Fibrobacteria bacterium]|nr:class I SAM-dependent methyltransferase [Fibrobacteria bacterium]